MRRCAAAPECARSYDPAADLAAVVGALQAGPARIVVGNATVTVDLPGFLDALIDDYLASPEMTVLLPGDLHALALRQWTTVVQRRGLTTSGDPPVPMQKITIGCSDAWARPDPAQVAQQAPTSFTPATLRRAAWWTTVCSAWPQDPGASGAVRTSVPIVFLNGSADPRRPAGQRRRRLADDAHALLVSVPGGGHGVLSGCLQGQVALFVESGAVGDEGAWTACARSLGAHQPPFPPGP